MDKDDSGTTIALGAVAGVVALVLIVVLGIAIGRGFGERAAPAAVAAETVELVLIEGPITGDLSGTLYFELGQATLPADAAATLAKVMQDLAAAAQRKVVLSGFHDASGGAASNAELAKQRAIGVREALIAGGADAARVGLRKPEQTTGSGNADEARRVEIWIVQ